jgi:glutathione reductase (NADPH)
VGVAEERFWGGTCVNVGCVPKKFMVNAAEYGQWAQDAVAFGWNIENHGHDWKKLAAARDAEVNRLSGIYGRLLQGAGVTSFDARATFIDDHTLQVGDKVVTAERIVIATGGRATRPEGIGTELGMISDDLFTLPELPKKVAVIGSGYIALEFACLLRGLGAEVEVFFRADQPLRGFDGDIRLAVSEAMTAQGIHMNAGCAPTRITKVDTGLMLTLTNNFMREVDAVFFCTGRAPNTEGLGLEKAGVTVKPNGAIPVDDEHATNVPHIYALGDVIDRINLTPMATAVGHALADTLFGNNPRKVSYENKAAPSSCRAAIVPRASPTSTPTPSATPSGCCCRWRWC